MRGTVAKELRARAELITVGQPYRQYTRKMRGTSPTGTIILAQSTRKAYKGLKRLFKSGVISVGPQQSVKGNQQAV